MRQPDWDFEYVPVKDNYYKYDDESCDLILATKSTLDPVSVSEVLSRDYADMEVVPVLNRHPLFWTRIYSSTNLSVSEMRTKLEQIGIEIRYITSSTYPSQCLPQPLRFNESLPTRAFEWQNYRSRTHVEYPSPERWFFELNGVNVVRSVCGTGAGTRLAIIDNGRGAIEHLDLEAEQFINVSEVERSSWHGALMAAWAVGTKGNGLDQGPFVGIAPDASMRLYYIPKPGYDVFSLALAIVCAVNDGADVVMCATYVNNTMSPMLHDALEFAAHLGRNGLGTAVVMPTSREFRSPAGMVSPSLSMGFGDPASDPRVLCIGPSSRDGGWFFWQDRQGNLHPFADRGPAVRWLAPGDDMVNPFSGPNTLAHAESSGASAIGAGVILLVLEANPYLTLSELEEILTRTASQVNPFVPDPRRIADIQEVLPLAQDLDGHCVKHGYGRLNAYQACLAVSDPICFALVAMGEIEAAESYQQLREVDRLLQSAYSAQLAHWAVKTLLVDTTVSHALRSLARYARLMVGKEHRQRAQPRGAALRQVALVLHTLERSKNAPPPPRVVADELAYLVSEISMLTGLEIICDEWEKTFYEYIAKIWTQENEVIPDNRIASQMAV